MVCTIKKAIILTLALGLTVCAHLRPVCRHSLGDELVDSGCSITAAKRAEEAARAAAEEILPGRAYMPAPRRHISLTLRAPVDTAPELCDALLRNTAGIMAGDALYAGGQRLGAVADGEELKQAIDVYIKNTLPTWASSGFVNMGMELRPVYTRAEWEIAPDDMVMLITGLSPVMYTDGNGRVSPV